MKRRYYFHATDGIIDCVMACSITEAKEQAFKTYGHKWPELQWINADSVTESVVYD